MFDFLFSINFSFFFHFQIMDWLTARFLVNPESIFRLLLLCTSIIGTFFSYINFIYFVVCCVLFFKKFLIEIIRIVLFSFFLLCQNSFFFLSIFLLSNFNFCFYFLFSSPHCIVDFNSISHHFSDFFTLILLLNLNFPRNSF